MKRRFSERVAGFKVGIEVGSVSEPLRNSLWNFVSTLIPSHHEYSGVRGITERVLRLPVENVPYPGSKEWLLKHCVAQLDWAGWYDLLEDAVDHAWSLSGKQIDHDKARQRANIVLEREHSGYRFVGDQLEPITNPIEIAEIEGALDRTAAAGLDGAREHIDQALALLGKRPDPDHRNAIKEAISAVESAARVISGKEKATLDDALVAVGKASPIHKAQVDAFRKLYGYTSDEKGIRHSLLEEDAKVDEEDARFMIVACSAFVNLLVVKADKAGLLKSR